MNMEWLLDIVPSHGRLAARLALSGARTEVVSFDDVYKRGLPEVPTNFSARVTLDFSELVATDASAELALIGLQLPLDLANRHEAFAVIKEGRRWVVPSLALMREIFVPTRFLLAEMVKPQALDRVSRTMSDGSLVVDAPWAGLARSFRLRDCSKVLTWLHESASARAMADSVHINALDGRVGLALPKGTAVMNLKGVDLGHSVLVLNVDLMSVQPSDFPGTETDAPYGCIPFRGRPPQSSQAEVFLPSKRCDVPLGNGGVEISDGEWTEIQRLFRAAGMLRENKVALYRRMLLDGVLLKLSTGVAWRSATYKAGDWRNAAAAFREWTRGGVFDQILECLRHSRAAEKEVTETQLAT
jgi:hypothetical protein